MFGPELIAVHKCTVPMCHFKILLSWWKMLLEVKNQIKRRSVIYTIVKADWVST